jgi:hypothetical protein
MNNKNSTKSMYSQLQIDEMPKIAAFGICGNEKSIQAAIGS